MERLVVVGGVAAGMSAAAKAKRLRPDWQVDVYTEASSRWGMYSASAG